VGILNQERIVAENHRWPTQGIVQLVGAGLVVSGAMFLLARYLQIPWLSLLIVPMFGVAFLIAGVTRKQISLLIPGCILIGLGVGAFILLAPFFNLQNIQKIGYLVSAFGLSWLVVVGLIYLYKKLIAWWAVLMASIALSVGLCLLSTPAGVLDFVLYISLGIGSVFLAWGIHRKLLGLIIPGALLTTIGAGVYLGWTTIGKPNGLTGTGIMLVWFALGWIMITVFSRVITTKFVWWPLIPGGILAVVGWGLYIGGNPGNALSFISNTGSIALIIIGIYLLLLRRGIHR